MTDWSVGIETRNYCIERKIDRRHLLDLVGVFVSILMIAASLFFHSWIRSRIVDIGYEIQVLQEQEQELIRKQDNLVLEKEVLKNPARIDVIARTELGMSPLRPDQLIPAKVQEFVPRGPTLAMRKDHQRNTNSRELDTSN